MKESRKQSRYSGEKENSRPGFQGWLAGTRVPLVRTHRLQPYWGICAGTILLARTVDGRPGILGVLPVEVSRNAYGRQLDSSEKKLRYLHCNGHNFTPCLSAHLA